MEATYKSCQSCGMPFSRDPLGGGTNVDGSTSRVYCSHCFAQGRFTQPDLGVSEMQTLVRGKMRDMGFPGFVAGLFTRKIPRLHRWKPGTRDS
ncbi:MAG: zinc ribbon domain-containing protein [Acidobacteria bacterium]|nr:zinc ribbon domain-containing protein [Acidobacteriota bacterium]